MADFTLVIGNKNYSSWSLRGWLMARIAGIEFEELVIPLDLPETQPEIRKHSPRAACRCCCIADSPSGSRWRSANIS